MNLPSSWCKNQRSKMTQKRFCRGQGYPPKSSPMRPQSPPRFDARSPQMGPRRYAAIRQLLLRGIGLQRRYPIWGLRASLNVLSRLPNLEESVTYVAGRFCYLCS